MKLYNTMNRKKEEFVPLNGNKVNFYACGPTVYDYIHIGNARPLIMFDVFRRYLEYRNYEVNYIVNITDVDDKIIRRAEDEGLNFMSVARTYTDAFLKNSEKLGVREATVHPRATDNIDGMLELIQTLINKGRAYDVDGDVYYDISSFKGYGKLSGRDVEQMQAGARVDIDERKRNPLDFALWKAAKPNEPSWDSPWGPGRPGWHIECSVMSMKYGGETLDIHAGGQDLVFPHHENELAQSEGANEKPFARYWLHNGFLDIEGEKMSKSLGNFLTVQDILKKYDPMAIRMFFLLKHYRSPIDFSEERIKEAAAALERLKNAYRKMRRILDKQGTTDTSPKENTVDDITTLKAGIEEAMDDDFNTARAMGYLFDLARIINGLDESDESAQSEALEAIAVFDTLATEVFGLVFETETADDGIADDLMKLIIDLRQNARAEKNWGIADAIRNGLKDIGITLEDRPDGTSWTRE
ncbi:cysteine--tRNA ligase [Candidatus Latescibacterota bacterium]